MKHHFSLFLPSENHECIILVCDHFGLFFLSQNRGVSFWCVSFLCEMFSQIKKHATAFQFSLTACSPVMKFASLVRGLHSGYSETASHRLRGFTSLFRWLTMQLIDAESQLDAFGGSSRQRAAARSKYCY